MEVKIFRTVVMSLLYIPQKHTLNKVTYFSKICYYLTHIILRPCGANVAPTTHFRASAMFLLLIVE
jgi:hypothetical protein